MNPVTRTLIVTGTENVATGMVDRGLHGQNPFDPAGLGTDLLLGGVAAVPGGSLGATRLADEAAGVPLYRGMREAADALPEVGPTARSG